MTYEDFEKFVREQCMYETIYDDSDGRRILVIRLLDAYGLVNQIEHQKHKELHNSFGEMLDKLKENNNAI
jgi:hypothetical protein